MYCIHLPTGDIISAHNILAQDISVAHVSGDLQGGAFQLHFLSSPVPEVHAAQSSSPSGQLSPQVPGVQVAAPLPAAGPPAPVAVSRRGGVACLQTRAGLAQSPR